MPILDSMGTAFPPSPKSPDAWERAKTVAAVLSVVVIPLALSYAGNQYSTALKERELQGKFVELAVSILKEPPEKQSRNLRDWATQIITKYSGVPLSDEAKRELIETTPLPGATAAVRDVQAMLTRLGYYSGSADGFVGASLREAVSKFQRDNGLPTDGIMGAQTVHLLIERYASAGKEQAPRPQAEPNKR